jgi:oryzin
MRARTCYLFLFAALASATSIEKQTAASLNTIIPGRYIVRLRSGADIDSLASHKRDIQTLLSRRESVDDTIISIDQTWEFGNFSGYVGSFKEELVSDIFNLEDVISIEPDAYIYLEPTTAPGDSSKRDIATQFNSIWSLADLSHREAGATDYMYDESAGEGTTAYVFDTGIRLSHEEFAGRASFGINGLTGSTINDGSNSGDRDGHGTHVAATIIGKKYGVAKKARAIDVKVFEGDTGSISAILTGLSWAVNDIISKGAQDTSVLSMSLSTSVQKILDDSIIEAYSQGILTVTAAGNNDGPAASYSPAHLPQAFTVGMTQPDRARVQIIPGIYGSNYGPELDVFAPGRDIISASHESDNGISIKTGTSMATPLVSGLVCYLRALERNLTTPDAVTERILQMALKDTLTNTGSGSPNLLVNNGSRA